MARILIRNSDRRVLFYSPEDYATASNPIVAGLIAKHGGTAATTVLSISSVPSTSRRWGVPER